MVCVLCGYSPIEYAYWASLFHVYVPVVFLFLSPHKKLNFYFFNRL